MTVYNSTKELVGNTPLVRLTNMGFPEELKVYAKLELWNPGGSVKDRIGVSMIEQAEKDGRLVPGKSTIVSATAGNTGLGIAFAAIGKGYKIIFVVPDKFSEEKQALIRAYGAEIVNTPRSGGMLDARKKADEIMAATPGAVTLEQFTDMANPEAHYLGTGREIFDDLSGNVDIVVAGAGSGGTISGVTKFLKERIPTLKSVLADPIGSIMGGGPHGDYEIEGIGGEFIADTFDIGLIDEFIKISDDEAFSTSRELAKNEGIVAGSSSGAAGAAGKKLAAAGNTGNLVVILPDRGDRYFSKNLF